MDTALLQQTTVEEILKTAQDNKGLDRTFIGIIDANGMESLIQVNGKSKEELNHEITNLKLRAGYNRHRSPIIYSVTLPTDIYKDIHQSLAINDRTKPARLLENSGSKIKYIKYD